MWFVLQDVRGPSPVHNFLENIRGPLPPPGHLLGMKAPFHRCSRSPLNFPLFPLNSQRRWSEAAANTLQGEPSIMDADANMRRWSMPWESKSDRNTVTWHQTRIISRMAMPPNIGHAIYSKASSDRSQTTTPGMSFKATTFQLQRSIQHFRHFTFYTRNFQIRCINRRRLVKMGLRKRFNYFHVDLHVHINQHLANRLLKSNPLIRSVSEPFECMRMIYI